MVVEPEPLVVVEVAEVHRGSLGAPTGSILAGQRLAAADSERPGLVAGCNGRHGEPHGARQPVPSVFYGA